MRVSFFLALSYVTVAVWAGGYQGCLERVWSFQAYEIDGLNDEADQTLGFRCMKWDDTAKKCKADWKPCPGKGGGRCNFDEFVFHLGKAPQRTGWIVNVPGTEKLDVEKTAVRCQALYAEKRGAVPNFPPHTVMKDTSEYNDYISKIARTVNGAYATKKTDDTKHLWEDFDRTTENVRIARAGDHGKHLIELARKEFPDSGTLKVHEQVLGTNPLTGEAWKTVDWKVTVNEARKAGVADASTRIRAFLGKVYHDESSKEHKSSREHYQVIKSYKRVSDQNWSCRRR